MMNFKAVIFDMDGLLIDSMYHWLKIDKQFFAQKGVELTPDIIRYLTGKSIKESVIWMKQEFGWGEALEDMVHIRREIIDRIYTQDSQAMPGADELVKRLGQTKLRQAIASGASERLINIIVDRFGWREYFNELISVEQVEHKGKPEPDVYLYTAEVLQVKPEACVVLEDAENGVRSAKAAGMKCIAVPDKRWSFGDFSQADLIVDSLENEEISNYLKLPIKKVKSSAIS